MLHAQLRKSGLQRLASQSHFDFESCLHLDCLSQRLISLMQTALPHLHACQRLGSKRCQGYGQILQSMLVSGLDRSLHLTTMRNLKRWSVCRLGHWPRRQPSKGPSAKLLRRLQKLRRYHFANFLAGNGGSEVLRDRSS